MHALTDHEVRVPTLQVDTDAIVRVDAVTTCHEVVGTVEAVGPGVKTIEVGDRVLASCLVSCDTPAERVRVPCANTSAYKLPEGVTDGQMLMLATFFRPATPMSAATRGR